jgi:D-glycero-D-manno-heptose 1,7-bisphosphate phosphatase
MSRVRAVLFDRDGTLVEDVPHNGDPDRVRPVADAREALGLLRLRGIRTGAFTHQSGIARGLLTDADVRHVNHRVDELLGPFDVWGVCPHGPDDGCHCRTPEPGLILWAAGRLCTAPPDCVVVGAVGADVEAARRAGAHGILVPTPETRPEETADADHVAKDLLTVVRAVLNGPPKGHVLADERPIEAAYDTGGARSAGGAYDSGGEHAVGAAYGAGGAGPAEAGPGSGARSAGGAYDTGGERIVQAVPGDGGEHDVEAAHDSGGESVGEDLRGTGDGGRGRPR